MGQKGGRKGKYLEERENLSKHLDMCSKVMGVAKRTQWKGNEGRFTIFLFWFYRM